MDDYSSSFFQFLFPTGTLRVPSHYERKYNVGAQGGASCPFTTFPPTKKEQPAVSTSSTRGTDADITLLTHSQHQFYLHHNAVIVIC